MGGGEPSWFSQNWPSLVETAGAVLTTFGLGLLPLLLLPFLVLAAPKPLAAPATITLNLIDRISGIAMGVSAAFALAIILIQLAAVLVRYVFGLSPSWLIDSVLFSFAGIFMLGAAATLRDDGHVRVDILRPRYPGPLRAIVELAGVTLFLWPVCALVLYAGGASLARSWVGLEPFNESDGLPVRFIFRTFVPLFAILLMLQGLSQALKAALQLSGRRPTDEAPRQTTGPV